MPLSSLAGADESSDTGGYTWTDRYLHRSTSEHQNWMKTIPRGSLKSARSLWAIGVGYDDLGRLNPLASDVYDDDSTMRFGVIHYDRCVRWIAPPSRTNFTATLCTRTKKYPPGYLLHSICHVPQTFSFEYVHVSDKECVPLG